MAPTHVMPEFVFPERPQRLSTSTHPEGDHKIGHYSSDTHPRRHNSSSLSSGSSNSVLMTNTAASTSPSDSSCFDMNFNSIPSTHAASGFQFNHSLDDLDSQERTSSSTSVSKSKHQSHVNTNQTFNAISAQESVFHHPAPLLSPSYQPNMSTSPTRKKPRAGHTYNPDLYEASDSNFKNPVQEGYRSLTTPSASHPSPTISVPSEPPGPRSQRQYSFSSPSRNQKQFQLNVPNMYPRSHRDSFSQNYVSTCTTPSRDSFSQNLPPRTSSPLSEGISIDALIQLEVKSSSLASNADDSSVRLVQLLVYHNVINRLQASAMFFNRVLANFLEKLKFEQFLNSYNQGIEFTNSILDNGYNARGRNFMASLKPSNRRVLTSFLTIIKQKPSFICACLSEMTDIDIPAFYTSSSSDPLDDFTSLHRGNALDIIFYSFFPPSAPPSQRFEYFAFIVSFLLDHHPGSENVEKVCLAILDRILMLSSTNHLSSLEPLLLGFLQNGQFLLKGPPSQSINSVHSRTNLDHSIPSTPVSNNDSNSAPTSAYSSPEPLNASLSMNSPSSQTSVYKHDAHQPSTKSISEESSNFTSKVYLPVDPSFEARRINFINESISKFLLHLRNSSSESIPEHLIHFTKLTFNLVSTSHQEYALNFIFFRFFLDRYIFTFFASPESLNMATNFHVSEKHRQRILLAIYNTMFHYAETIIFRESASHSVPEDIQTSLIILFEKFSNCVKKSTPASSSAATSSVTNNEYNEQHAFNDTSNPDLSSDSLGDNDVDEACLGQIFVISPADVLTLYTVLIPTNNIHRKTSFTGNTKPISVERDKSAVGPSAHFHSGSAPSITTGMEPGFQSSQNKSLPSLDEINHELADNYTSPRTTPLFETDDYCFKYNLDDIRADLEPATNELINKFSYLHFRTPGASQYLKSMRPQKLQNFRLPHPLVDRWQLFRMEKDGLIEVDKDNIVASNTLLEELDHGPIDVSLLSTDEFQFPPSFNTDDGQFSEFEKAPIPPSHKVYADLVCKAIESIIENYSSSSMTKPSNYLQTDPLSYLTANDTFSSISFNRLDHSSGIPPQFHSYSSYPTTSPAYLTSLLSDAGRRAIALNDYLKGNEYMTAVNALQKMYPPPSSNSYSLGTQKVNSYILKTIMRIKQKKHIDTKRHFAKCSELFQRYQVHTNILITSFDLIMETFNDLRTKCWFASEVKGHSLYLRAMEISIALNRGTGFEISSNISQPTLKRNNSAASLTSSGPFSSFKRLTGGGRRDYQHKRHSLSQTSFASLDSMFAPVEYAGHNKLSDREADSTKKWLDGQNIQNFCTGEERIHRFCCEVDDLVKRVIGDVALGRKRSQSLLVTSPYFKTDLGRLMEVIDKTDRTSSIASTLNYGANDTERRRSIDSISIDTFTQIRNKTTGSQHSDIGRSYSGRGHRSRKSSPNLLDMFSHMDVSSKRMSSSDIFTDFEKQSSVKEGKGHRRNQSLNECFSNLGVGNTSQGTEDFNIPQIIDDADRKEFEEKKDEVDQFVLGIQMKLISLIFTDLGLDGWSEGEWLKLFYCYEFHYVRNFGNFAC